MTPKKFEELKQKVQAQYDSDMAALLRVYKIAAPEVEMELVAPGSTPPKRKYTRRKARLSADEKIEKRRAYQRAYRARKHGNNPDENGLSPKKFNRFLVPGPHAGGGNG